MTKAEIWRGADARTRQAIRGSVRKWIKVVEGRGFDRGVSNCPLCGMFWEEAYCVGCPVHAFADAATCYGTPQEDWAAHACENCYDQGEWASPDCPESLRLAKAELRFLAGFLPSCEKLHAKVKEALAAKLKDTRARALRKSS